MLLRSYVGVGVDVDVDVDLADIINAHELTFNVIIAHFEINLKG